MWLAVALSMPLIGHAGVGHGCPTTDAIYTARHVVVDKDGNRKSYSSDFGNTKIVWVDSVRDIATIAVPKPVPRLHVAESVAVGAKVHWYEYHTKDTKQFFAPQLRKAKVVRTVAGHIVFDKGPTAGASGTCLLNEDDEVVGIVFWRYATARGHKHTGFAVSVVGDWKP